MRLIASLSRGDTAVGSAVFGIARDPEDNYGAIARIHGDEQSEWDPTGKLRLVAEVLGRYHRVSPPEFLVYPRITAGFLCERTTAAVTFDFPRDLARRRGVSTRSAVRAQGVRRRRASMGGLPFAAWRGLDPRHLLARVRELLWDNPRCRQLFHEDELIMDAMPEDGACPAQWSFWLSAAIRASPAVKDRLLQTTCTTTRLRNLLALLTNASFAQRRARHSV